MSMVRPYIGTAVVGMFFIRVAMVFYLMYQPEEELLDEQTI